MKHIKYEQVESSGRGSNPLRTTGWQAELGKDPNGTNWFVKINWLYGLNSPVNGPDDYIVLFDNDIEGDNDMIDEDDGVRYNSSTFHRNIKYGGSTKAYWKSKIDVYHGKYVKYDDINRTVQNFIEENNIK